MLLVLAVALLVHALDIASLFALFRAFNVIAPVGVVEGLMPLVYTSPGLPVAEATVITLAFRGPAFWIPFLLGFALLRRLPVFTPPQRGLAQLSQVRLIAMLTGSMGLLNVLSASTPALANRTAVIVPPPLTHTLLHELREVSDEWLVRMHGKEMRFSLGWFDNDYIGNSAVIVVRNDTGRVIGFGLNPDEAGHRARAALLDGFAAARQSAIAEWQAWQDNLPSAKRLTLGTDCIASARP